MPGEVAFPGATSILSHGRTPAGPAPAGETSARSCFMVCRLSDFQHGFFGFRTRPKPLSSFAPKPYPPTEDDLPTSGNSITGTARPCREGRNGLGCHSSFVATLGWSNPTPHISTNSPRGRYPASNTRPPFPRSVRSMRSWSNISMTKSWGSHLTAPSGKRLEDFPNDIPGGAPSPRATQRSGRPASRAWHGDMDHAQGRSQAVAPRRGRRQRGDEPWPGPRRRAWCLHSRNGEAALNRTRKRWSVAGPPMQRSETECPLSTHSGLSEVGLFCLTKTGRLSLLAPGRMRWREQDAQT